MLPRVDWNRTYAWGATEAGLFCRCNVLKLLVIRAPQMLLLMGLTGNWSVPAVHAAVSTCLALSRCFRTLDFNARVKGFREVAAGWVIPYAVRAAGS